MSTKKQINTEIKAEAKTEGAGSSPHLFEEGERKKRKMIVTENVVEAVAGPTTPGAMSTNPDYKFEYIGKESDFVRTMSLDNDLNILKQSFGFDVTRNLYQKDLDQQLVECFLGPGQVLVKNMNDSCLKKIENLLDEGARPYLYRKTSIKMKDVYVYENILMLAVSIDNKLLLELLKEKFIDFWQEDFFSDRKTMSWYSYALKYGTNTSKEILISQSRNPLRCLLAYQQNIPRHIFRDSLLKLCKDKKWTNFEMKTNFEEQLDFCLKLETIQSHNMNAVDFWANILYELGFNEKIDLSESILNNSLLLRTQKTLDDNGKWLISQIWFDKIQNKRKKYKKIITKFDNKYLVNDEHFEIIDKFLINTLDKFTEKHSVNTIEFYFDKLIAVGGEGILLELNSSDIDYNNENQINYAVKFSPTLLKDETVKKLKDKMNDVSAIREQKTILFTNVNQTHSTITDKETDELGNSNSKRETEIKKIKTTNEIKKLANKVFPNFIKLFDKPKTQIRSQSNEVKTPTDSDKHPVKLTDDSTVSRAKTDVKAISHDGMFYDHKNIVSVKNQTVDIIHDIPMRVIGM